MKSIFAATLVAATIGSLGAAAAMPLAPLPSDGATVIPVAQGCGPGFERGYSGRCRPMRGPMVRGPAIVVPGVAVVRPGGRCGPGFSWRYGRCRPY